LVALHPRPSQETLINNYKGYLPHTAAAIRQWERLVRPVIGTSAELIAARMKGTGRLLDIGCGFGFFLERMQRDGWKVTGIEVSPAGRRYAVERWGFDVRSQPLELLDLKPEQYDVVTLFYVIEHVFDPLRLLERVRRILKPGGLVLLRWPHTTPIVKLLKPWARRLDLYHTPYHIYDFSPATMNRLLKRTGFSAVETVIGGYTHPAPQLARWATMACGRLAQGVAGLSSNRWLLPGVSKTTIARAYSI
jgi:SAM-dependent methyltransferase